MLWKQKAFNWRERGKKEIHLNKGSRRKNSSGERERKGEGEDSRAG